MYLRTSAHSDIANTFLLKYVAQRLAHSITKVMVAKFLFFSPICVSEGPKGSYFPIFFFIDSLDFAIMTPLASNISCKNSEKPRIKLGEEVCVTLLISN